MSYASWNDVQALNVSRTIGAGSNPTATQVQRYCEFATADINAILINKGYELPVPWTATEALELLQKIAAEGGLAMQEKASPASQILKEAEIAYANSLKMLESADDVLNIPKERTRSEPRGPGVTTPPQSNNPCATEPYFKRDMSF